MLHAGSCSSKTPYLFIPQLNPDFIRDSCVAALSEVQSPNLRLSYIHHSSTHYLPRDISERGTPLIKNIQRLPLTSDSHVLRLNSDPFA